MKIVVLAGGLSNERDVSLKSGSLVANALLDQGHDVFLLDLFIGSEDNYVFKRSSDERYNYEIKESAPELDNLKKLHNNSSLIGPNVIKICQEADIVFVALHGDIGEDGKLQALFDTLSIKYTGTGFKGSMLSMDKDLTKKLLKNDNIKTANWINYNIYDDISKYEINYPCVVKPCNNGSSVGISIVNNKEELKEAITMAGNYEDNLLIEDYLEGREFSVGFLDDMVLPPIEIIPNEGFYDYKNKYVAGLTKEICPADLTKSENKKLEELVLKVKKTLQLDIYSRIDVIYCNNDFYVLEANTLPGMTNTSLLPQEAKAFNISYNELCEKIIEISFKKYQ